MLNDRRRFTCYGDHKATSSGLVGVDEYSPTFLRHSLFNNGGLSFKYGSIKSRNKRATRYFDRKGSMK